MLAGCSGAPDEPVEPAEPLTPTGVTDEVEEPVEVSAPDHPWLLLEHIDEWTGDLDGMAERGVVRLLTIPSRTHFFLDGGRERGIAVDIAAVLQEFLNERLKETGDGVQVVLIPVRRDQLLQYLVRGFGDIASANLTITPERMELVDFSRPRVREVRELVVTAPSVPAVETPAELSGREIWVRRSSSYAESLERLSEEIVKDGWPEVNIRWADENLEDEDILEMVHAGLLPATVVDSHKLELLWEEIFDQAVVNRDCAIRTGGAIASAVRKDSPLLLEALNEFYRRHGSGTMTGNMLIKRYFSKQQWLRDISAGPEMKKFDALDELFEQYAAEYDFDYLMLMAQGYQESKLDQSARSHVGAIGVMQVLPSTASGPPVFIPNVEETEPNVHAGIKYLRFVVDHYFDDPEIDPVNRLLFAFAAYNAGPNRIARIRREAEQKGFDPNVWFQEVETVAEARIGREPVRYVRNIYKYYLAYTELRDLASEREEARRELDGAGTQP